jgi:sugar phosphate isomerase/epimerase
MMRYLSLIFWGLLIFSGCACDNPTRVVCTESIEADISKSDWQFFAFCADIHDDKKRTIPQQAAMLKELGYAGYGHLWLDDVELRSETLSLEKLRLFQVYIRVDLSSPQPLDEKRIAQILPVLRRHKTQLALLFVGGKPLDEKHDDDVAALMKRLADISKPYDVTVVLYPHSGFWLETTHDAIRIARKVNRPGEVGVMFNLCHWMKTDPNRDLRAVLKDAQPWLMSVSLSGSDTPEEVRTGNGNWIQPLGQGTYDIREFLDILRDTHYSGPVGLQCWGIRGDARMHLEQSMKTWKDVTKGM